MPSFACCTLRIVKLLSLFLAWATLNYYMLLFGGGAGSFMGFVPFAWVGLWMFECSDINSAEVQQSALGTSGVNTEGTARGEQGREKLSVCVQRLLKQPRDTSWWPALVSTTALVTVCCTGTRFQRIIYDSNQFQANITFSWFGRICMALLSAVFLGWWPGLQTNTVEEQN